MKKIKKRYWFIGIPIIILSVLLWDYMKPPKIEDINPNQVVIVTGAQPEGIAAAVGASRAGAKVYLLNKQSHVGGLFTNGMMSALDLNYKTRLPIFVLHKGYFKEFYKAAGNGYNFDIQKALLFFQQSIEKAKITTISDINEWKPIMQDSKVIGIEYYKDNRWEKLLGNVVIDSSQDAEIARKAGASYRLGRQEMGLQDSFAASTLVFSVEGVDWKEVKNYLKNDENPYTNAIGNAAWGYSQMFNYKAKHPQIQMRGLNLSKQNDESVIINALLIFGVNPLQPELIEDGRQAAIGELDDIVAYMRKNLAGFENAELKEYAKELYIREGVRIIGEQTLIGEDVFSHKDYWNKVAFGSYPIDLQASYKGGYGNNLSGRSLYSIPFGVMIPKGVQNLLVASRSSSFDIIAHGSSRTVPVLMALGQAAGVSAQYAIAHELNFTQINESKQHMKAIQKRLKDQKVDLGVHLPPNKDETHWAYPYLVRLREKGFVSGGSKTKFLLEEPATPDKISVTVSLIKQHSLLKLPTITAKEIPKEIQSKDYLKIISKLLMKKYDSWEELYKEGIINQEVYDKMKTDQRYTNAHSYALLEQIVENLAKQQQVNLKSE